MNDSDHFERATEGDDSGSAFDAALRAAFGPPSIPSTWDRRGVLEVLEQSTGVTSRIMLRDEPDAPSPVVDPAQGLEALAAGRQGRYQVLGEIARGGMGVVLKSRDPDLGRDVAMKVLQPGHADDPALIRRFIEEAQIGGQLQHPGILPVYELGLDAGLRPYFTMRLVKGRTLAALLEERPHAAHDLGRLVTVFEQICQTLAYAHARGVIHRDLKPSNIMVGAFGEVQVVDWGLSKVLRQGPEGRPNPGQSAESDEPQVTTVRTTGVGSPSQAGSIIGTPAYMSPEQAQGEVADLDEQTDVFSLGAILCEVLTGEPPYTGSRPQLLEDAAAGRLDAAFGRLDASGAERDLIQLAKRALSPGRALRPRHAGVLAREVSAFLAAVGDRARAAEIAAAEARATAAADRRARRRTTGLAVALGLAVAIGATFALLAERHRWARAEQSINSVAALFQKSNWFLDRARTLPPDQLDTWEEALGWVRRTVEIIGTGAADARSRETFDRLLVELKTAEQSVRDRALEHRSRRSR